MELYGADFCKIIFICWTASVTAALFIGILESSGIELTCRRFAVIIRHGRNVANDSPAFANQVLLLALVHNHFAFLDHHRGLQPFPVTNERVAIDKNDVGQLARCEFAELVAHLDV
jgi:hypothetical protein